MTRLPVVSGRQLVKALAKVDTSLIITKGAISFSGISPRHTVGSASRIIRKSPKGLCGKLFEKAV